MGFEPTSPPYEGGILAAGPPVPDPCGQPSAARDLDGRPNRLNVGQSAEVGPEGLEPSPAWVRTRDAAANTSIPICLAVPLDVAWLAVGRFDSVAPNGRQVQQKTRCRFDTGPADDPTDNTAKCHKHKARAASVFADCSAELPSPLPFAVRLNHKDIIVPVSSIMRLCRPRSVAALSS